MRRAIGRGLSQLIDASPEPRTQLTQGLEASIDSIVPNSRQPRHVFDQDALEELAASIREVGVLQPIVVRPIGKDKYELIAGERRLRASKLAGLKKVPITVRSVTNEASLSLAIIENVQREDINPMECARAFRQLVDEFGLSQEQVAKKVGKSRVSVTNTLRLLRLPKRIQDAINREQITEAHARALLGFESEAHMLAVFDTVVEKGLTVKDVEERAKSVTRPTKRKGRPASTAQPEDPNERALAEALSIYLGAETKIKRGRVGGEIAIQFYSDEDLQRILDVLGFRL